MNKALQNFFLHFIYFFFLPGSPWSFALFIHLPICCLIWHQLLLMSLLSYCFLYRSLTSTQRDCFFTCSHALPCEKTQGTVCAPRQTPYVRFNAWPPHEGHIVHSVYSDTRQFIEADGRGFMVKNVKLHFEQCRWIPAARTVVWVQCCTEPLLSERQTVCSENHSHYCWRCLSCEQDKTQDKNWAALSARQNPYLPQFVTFHLI